MRHSPVIHVTMRLEHENAWWDRQLARERTRVERAALACPGSESRRLALAQQRAKLEAFAAGASTALGFTGPLSVGSHPLPPPPWRTRTA